MNIGLSLEASVPVLTVFLQGLLSFFPPCVLPLIPFCINYLTGGVRDVDSDGSIHYPRGGVLVNTLFFVMGIGFTFFLPGFGFTILGSFFRNNQIWLVRISGIIMILPGLYQFGVFGHSDALEREHRLPFRLDRWAINPLVALVSGFTFSFAWTPCVGSTLGNVLLMVSSAGSAACGFLSIVVYTLGFVIPFLTVGLSTGMVLGSFKCHQRVVRYTVKMDAILLVFMGVIAPTGFMNGITNYLSSVAGSGVAETPQAQASGAPAPAPEGSAPAEPKESPVASGRSVIPALGFTLAGQYGEEYTLSDYEGKMVFFNFWVTWCGPCKREVPEVQVLYEKYGNNEEDVTVLGVANPESKEYPYHQDITQPEMEQFLGDGDCTFPVVMDVAGEVFYSYGISVFPITFMIGVGGDVFSYVPGALTGGMMKPIVQQTIDGAEAGA